MIKYIKPEMNVKLFEMDDIITTSTGDTIVARMLKTDVNGNKGTDYGSQQVSIFE